MMTTVELPSPPSLVIALPPSSLTLFIASGDGEGIGRPGGDDMGGGGEGDGGGGGLGDGD